MTPAVLGALAIAVFGAVSYAAGSILQAVGARRSKGTVRTLGHPLYLLGVACDILSWAGSMVALRELAVYQVQSVLAGSLAVTVIMARIFLGSRLRRRDGAAVVITIAALAVLAMSAGPQEQVAASTRLRIGFCAAAAATVLIGYLAAKFTPPGVVGGLSGLAFGGAALAGRALVLPEHPTQHVGATAIAIFTEPLTAALVVFAATGMLLYTHALQHGQVGPVTAVLWIGEVVAPSAVGLALLGDTVLPGWQLRAAIAGFIVVASAVVLASAPATSDTAQPTAEPSAAPALRPSTTVAASRRPDERPVGSRSPLAQPLPAAAGWAASAVAPVSAGAGWATGAVAPVSAGAGWATGGVTPVSAGGWAASQPHPAVAPVSAGGWAASQPRSAEAYPPGSPAAPVSPQPNPASGPPASPYPNPAGGARIPAGTYPPGTRSIPVPVLLSPPVFWSYPVWPPPPWHQPTPMPDRPQPGATVWWGPPNDPRPVFVPPDRPHPSSTRRPAPIQAGTWLHQTQPQPPTPHPTPHTTQPAALHPYPPSLPAGRPPEPVPSHPTASPVTRWPQPNPTQPVPVQTMRAQTVHHHQPIQPPIQAEPVGYRPSAPSEYPSEPPPAPRRPTWEQPRWA
jgi:drug/metabolite transporter (DMT)-like permease